MLNKVTLILFIAFWLLFLGRTALLMLQGVRVFVIGRGKNIGEKLLELALVPLLILWSAGVVWCSLGNSISAAPIFWDAPAVRWIGVALCALGLVIFLAALISFGSAWRVGIDDQNSSRLVTGGIFRLSRNPIFLFMDMFFVGIFLVYPNWFFLALFIGVALGVHRQILNEENFLRKKFGGEYESYCAKVRRYL